MVVDLLFISRSQTIPVHLRIEDSLLCQPQECHHSISLYDIEYHCSADHLNADALSWLPLDGMEPPETAGNVFYFAAWDDIPLQATDIAMGTKRDTVLFKVLDFTLHGWPSYVER